ncbi:MAG: ribonuclease R [Rhodospirillales bacterium]|nr:ribonuclease R [Rhodospirillales bacterium]MCB9965731.1 ribonuclease R [Rhodospirillales bacterium]MCB9979659.1 ribonuclease R [Rhodospirillales bacterium]
MRFHADSLLSFLTDSPQPQTKREIARAFGIKGEPDRVLLKQVLKDLETSGRIVRHTGGAYSVPQGLPGVTVIEVIDIDVDGDVFARPADEKPATDVRIEVMPDKRGHPALKEGDRVLAALTKRTDGVYEAKILKRLDSEKGRVLGLVSRKGNAYTLEPANKKIRDVFDIPQVDLNGAQEGTMAVGEIQPARGLHRKKVRIVEIIGHADDPKAISLLSMHEVGLRHEFPAQVIESTNGMTVPPVGKREDLRKIPLITIDGADARDFDDAVFAEPSGDGFHLIVAIADVSFYVRPGSPLDKEAYARGNSTYFPDRVVPMLPEALSNDLCSLRPDEDRACLAAHLWINMSGKLVRHKFVRGLMRSQARCTYEQVQALYEGQLEHTERTLAVHKVSPHISALYDAFKILEQAREHRGALDLDMPERQILINEQGDMTGVRLRTRLAAHKLIEEFMILANVAAAEALEAKSAPCVYRVHESPKPDRLHSAGEFIEGFGLSLPKAQNTSPHQLNRLLKQASALPYAHLIHEVILRAQSQARYSQENHGHYGLALSRYAHFTSPIRRYADLIVHRSLTRAYGLGDGRLDDEETVRLEGTCQHISDCERRSIEAERASVDRFTAAYLSSQIDSEFRGRISGVTRFGLFVTLNESGADGIVPIRSLANDYYVHDEERHALIGRRTRTIYRLGAEVTVRLREADALTGSTVLELVGHQRGADIPGFSEPNHLRRKTAPGKERERKDKGYKKGGGKDSGKDQGGRDQSKDQKDKRKTGKKSPRPSKGKPSRP